MFSKIHTADWRFSILMAIQVSFSALKITEKIPPINAAPFCILFIPTSICAGCNWPQNKTKAHGELYFTQHYL